MHSAQNLHSFFSRAFKGENDTIELRSHMATWIIFKLQLLVAASLYIHVIRVGEP